MYLIDEINENFFGQKLPTNSTMVFTLLEIE